MSEHRPARSYASATPPRLYGLVPLAEAIATYGEARWLGVDGVSAADIIARASADMLEDAEHEILAMLRAGSIKAWAVPIGGGHTIAFRPELWETKEALRHLREGAADPTRWSVPDAPPTDWIVVEIGTLDATIERLFPGDDDMRTGRFRLSGTADKRMWEAAGAPVTQMLATPGFAHTEPLGLDQAPTAVSSPEVAPGTPKPGIDKAAPRRFITIKDVIARCGLSRTRIYEKIKGKTFPKQVRLGEQTARWYEDEVDEWIAAPR